MSERQQGGHERAAIGRRPRHLWPIACGAALLVACLIAARPGAAAPTPTPNPGDTVTVQVVNALSHQPLANLPVSARKRTGDSYAGFATKTTDATGRATFQLTGLAAGVRFAFVTTPYNGGSVQSADVSQAGTVRFVVGTMPVSVVAGGTNAPLAATRVSLKEKLADGTLRSAASGTTDATGLIIFDPPGLGSGRVYLLEAISPWDGSTKRSNEIRDSGGVTFVVGNAPLTVTLLDAISNAPLANLVVDAYERVADGSLQWRRNKTTSAVGRAVFDLDGLGAGRPYVLKVKAFNGLTSESEDLRAAGEFFFKVGALSVRVVAGGGNAPLANTKVDVYEKRADGTQAYVKGATTDANAVVRFDLAGLGSGRTYVLRAKSVIDGSSKYSNDVTQPGSMTFVVGNAPLWVAVVDALSGAAMPGLSVGAYEKLADGSTKNVSWRTTDAAGRATFDLAGLGSGRSYFLACWPFATGRARSELLKAPGDYTLRVGKLEVTVVNGADGTPLGSTNVSALERTADGKLKWFAGGRTDARGVIRFDLPGLGNGKTYVLETKSPWDGSTKRSDNLPGTGRYTFAVGRAPLRVRVTNGLSGDPVANLKVTANRRNGDKLEWVAQRTTDAGGAAVFDLDGLGSGQTFVLAAAPYNGGTVYSDELREPGIVDFKVGTVELTALSPIDGARLVGIKVTALAKNADGSATWVKSGTTDDRGVILFDLPGLGRGTVYVFEAKGLIDGSTRRSQEITSLGQHVFTVGNAPLLVTVRNGINGSPQTLLPVTAWERRADGSLRWAARRTTDGSGQVSFDLEGLGAGRTYVLSCEPYNSGTVYSDAITQTGPFTFRVGKLKVTLISGATGAIMVNAKVSAYELLPDGTRPWRAQGYTDAKGMIRFDLPGLADGRRYQLEARSTIDNGTRRSAEITAEGNLTFVVGNAPLRLALVNGVSGAPLAQVGVTARELLANNQTAWVREVATDAGGVAVFDLDGLGSGRRYVFYAKPYGAGITSDAVDAAGDVYFRVGTVPVTLIDGDNDVPLAGKKIIAYEKLPDGTRVWAGEGIADANGTAVFDLPGVSQTLTRQQPPAPRTSERVYAFRASNPFGNGKEYWSQLVQQEQAVLMRILRAVSQPLDVTPPQVSLLSPVSGGSVDADGFALLGEASDNVRIDRIVASLSDPLRGTTALATSYDAVRRQWTATVSASMISAGQTATLTVSAYDGAQNRATLTAALLVTADAAAPQIAIVTPPDGASVPRSGFLVSGTATDDIGVTSVVATVDDPVLGRSATLTLGVAPDGAWSFAVLSGQVTEGRTATVTVVARDAKSNQASAAVQLQVTGVDFLAHHVINRLTFGSTPELLFEVQRIGVDAFIDQQLAPETIDDGGLAAVLPAAAPATKAELQRQALLRMIYSRRQLLEVLTTFWDNHFNTDVNKTQVVGYEVAENALFRSRALGRFRDLLDASAKSPAMLVYLDQAASQRGMPNENYPRELMELHALGVDGGYTQSDVEQVARAFTGWTVQNGQFFFDAANHDAGQKVVLGHTLPAGRGIEDGEQVLDILAAHPSAARFICTKLATLLVSDTPAPGLVERCTAEYLATDGQIAALVRILVRSPEFAAPSAFRTKVRTPLEMAVFWPRLLGASTDASGLVTPIVDMGMRLFENPVPTGWSETGDDWVNSNLLLQRIRHLNRLVRNQITGSTVDLRAFCARNRQTTADGIAGFLLQQLFHSDFSPLEYDTAVGVLTDDGTRPFSLNQSDADARLRQLFATVLSFPGGQYQ